MYVLLEKVHFMAMLVYWRVIGIFHVEKYGKACFSRTIIHAQNPFM